MSLRAETVALAQRLIRMRDGLVVSDTKDVSVVVDGVVPRVAAAVAARVD